MSGCLAASAHDRYWHEAADPGSLGWKNDPSATSTTCQWEILRAGFSPIKALVLGADPALTEQGAAMRRRELLAALGGAVAAWPMVARAQLQPLPVIGFLSSQSSDAFSEPLRGFRKGLKEAGFVEGENPTTDTAGQ